MISTVWILISLSVFLNPEVLAAVIQGTDGASGGASVWLDRFFLICAFGASALLPLVVPL